jgi:hypothetical protein
MGGVRSDLPISSSWLSRDHQSTSSWDGSHFGKKYNKNNNFIFTSAISIFFRCVDPDATCLLFAAPNPGPQNQTECIQIGISMRIRTRFTSSDRFDRSIDRLIDLLIDGLRY